MNEVILCVGFNIDKRKSKIDEIKQDIELLIGKLVQCSSLYETEAWGNTDNDSFWNFVCAVQTELEPVALIKIIFEIEQKWKRIRSVKNAARTLDIDILFYNESVIIQDFIYNEKSHQLSIPHVHLHLRKFVLLPLSEILPQKKHPLFHKNIQELLEVCSDKLQVQRIE